MTDLTAEDEAALVALALAFRVEPVVRRAIARARQRYAATHPDRPRLRRMHAAYRARTRGRSRRG